MCILGQIYFGVKCLCFGQYTNDINLRYDIYINDFFRLTLNEWYLHLKIKWGGYL